MINRKAITSIFFITLLITQLGLTEVNAKSGNISSKLKKMAKKFSDSYTAMPGAVVPGTLAVFPFQTDEKLTKRKVDFAVGEIFTRQLIETGSFKVVERVELKRVLKEQKLGLTGAIETESAVEVGKLLGAQLMVMGSIARMGKAYQINARLVDARTGEVISTDFTEVDVKVFEEEAKPYITLVPEKQAIGAYVGLNFFNAGQLTYGADTFESKTYYCDSSPIIVGVYSNFTDPSSGISYSNDEETLDKNAIGVGVRYFPNKWLMLDVSGVPSFIEGRLNKSVSIRYFNSTDKSSGYYSYSTDPSIIISGKNNIRGAVFGLRDLGKKIKGYVGLGISYCLIKYEVKGPLLHNYELSDTTILKIKTTITDKDGKQIGSYDYDPGGEGLENDSIVALTDTTASFDQPFIMPFIKIGAEWRLQSRFGVALFGMLNFLQTKGKTYYLNFKGQKVDMTGEKTESGNWPETDLFEERTEFFTFNIKKQLQLELTFSLYF